MKKLLILGASRYYQKSIETLKAYGYKVYSIDMNENSPGFQVADGYNVIDIIDKENALKYAQELKIDGVIPINDFGIQTAAYINEKMGLNGIKIKTGELVTDKSKMREVWAKNGAPIPKFYSTDSYSDALEKVDNLNFPIIVKPSDSRGGGSRGIKVVINKNDLEEAFNFAQSFYENKKIVVEECVVGSEHSIEVVIKDKKAYILAISEKVKTPYPYRVDKQVIYPTLLSENNKILIADTVQKAVEGIGIDNGIAHIELALTQDGPILFEIGARPGGGATPQIIEYITGIEYLKLNAKIATGEVIEEDELKPKFQKAAIYHFFTFRDIGKKFITLNEIEKIKKIKHIIDFELFLKSGDIINRVQTGKDRQGFAVIIANSRKMVIEVARLLEKTILENIEVR